MYHAYVEFSTRACPAVIDGCIVMSGGDVNDDSSVRLAVSVYRNLDACNVRVRSVTVIPPLLVPTVETMLPVIRPDVVVTTIGILSLMLKG